MASRRVSFIIGANIQNFTKNLNKAQRSFRRFGRDMQRMGRSLTAGLTLPLVGAGAVAVKTAAEYETLRQSMDILNGSVEEGARNFERLKRFSARTPFQLQDLAKAQNMLQGFSLSADDAFESMSMIGDIAAVTGGSIQGIGIAFGQAAAEGRVMTRDIRQFINQGVPMIQMLADTMGVATSEILDLASKGEITFDILQKSFREATSEGGRFANGMQKQSQTLAGLFSTLRDNVSIALGELGEVISDTFNLKEVLKNVTTGVQAIVQSFKDMSDDSRIQMLKIAGLFAVTGPVAFAIGKFVQMLAGLLRFASKIFPMLAGIVRKNFLVITGAFIAAVAIGQALVDIWNTLAMNGKNFFISLEDSAKRGLSSVTSAVSGLVEDAFGSLSDAVMDMTGLNSVLEEFWKNFEENAKSAKQATDELNDSMRDFGEGIGRDSLPGLGIPAGELKKAEGNTDSLAAALGNMKEQAELMGQALQSTVTNAITDFAETVGNVFSGDAGAKNFFEGILLIVIDFANKFGKMLVGAGVAALAFKNLLANPIAAIVAGTALIAATTAVRNLLKEGPGGKSTNVNDALIRSDGSVVNFHPNDDILAMQDFSNLAPSFAGGGGNINLSGEFRVKGTDLVLSLERAKKKFV